MSKFDNLLREKEKHLIKKRRSLDQSKLVVNLSIKNQKEVLSLGLNFATTPRKIPAKEIIAGTEEFAKMMEDGQSLREGVKKCLEEAKPPKPNLTHEEREAIKELKKDNTIVILPADKGNATVGNGQRRI